LLTQRTLMLPDLVESDLSEALPPTHEEKQQLRNGLVKETNPLGKLMFLGSDWSMMFDQNDELQAAYGLTQVVLAGRLFWERHNRVPNSLNELVEEGFLDHLPIDPYAEVPLRYNPETGLVWSVYKDGRSNEGERMVVIEGGL